LIPRIIHYCWFGPNKYNNLIKLCIKSWKKACPDYHVKLWDEKNSPLDNKFVKMALENRKYAFMADFVRLHALFLEGGIYLDTDMLILKSPDDFLKYDLFIGKEDSLHLSAGIIGAVKNHPFIAECINFYNNSEFDFNSTKEFQIPIILTSVFNNNTSFNNSIILEPEVFYPYPWERRAEGDFNYKKYIKPNSYGVHLWDASWLDNKVEKPNFIKKKFYDSIFFLSKIKNSILKR